MIRAFLADGREVVLDPKHGQTVDDLYANLLADGLTGSAVPVDGAVLATVDGQEILYGQVNAFTTEDVW